MELRNEKRLTPKMETVLNEWLRLEFNSSQLYQSMAVWSDNRGYVGLKKMYLKDAGEEMIHYNKVLNYIMDRNCNPIIPESPKMSNEYSSFKEVIEKSLEHEMKISEAILAVNSNAENEKDKTTYFFTQWFINEQIEEEEKFRDILDELAIGTPEWFIDSELLK
jgi:ferritin